MGVRMRITRSKTGTRRSHHGVKAPELSLCPDCGAAHLRHRYCPSCGKYRGRLVIDVAAKQEKREEKRRQHKETRTAEAAEESSQKQTSTEIKDSSRLKTDEPQAHDDKEKAKTLSAETLSKKG